MRWFSRQRKRIPRQAAMGGRPVRTPVLRREEDTGGKTRITVTVPGPDWLRWIGGPKRIERSFRLDALGREVYGACDGQTDVETMIRRFAKKHHIGQAEAELAVTTFLKTLMMKGLVVMEMDRKPR